MAAALAPAQTSPRTGLGRRRWATVLAAVTLALGGVVGLAAPAQASYYPNCSLFIGTHGGSAYCGPDAPGTYFQVAVQCNNGSIIRGPWVVQGTDFSGVSASWCTPTGVWRNVM